jgi:hypothetical protein
MRVACLVKRGKKAAPFSTTAYSMAHPSRGHARGAREYRRVLAGSL